MNVIASLACALGLGATAAAGTVALYDAQAASPAPAPDSSAGGSWQIIEDAGTVTRGPVFDQGQNAWNITDDALNELLHYNDPLTTSARADLAANGWSLSFEARLTSATASQGGIGFRYTGNAFDRYMAFFAFDDDGELQVRAQTSVGASTTLSASGLVPAGTSLDSYHTITILNTDGVGDAEIYFDGALVTFDTGETSILPRTIATDTRGVTFGALFAGSTASGNIRRVELIELPAPSTMSAVIPLGLLALRRRRSAG